MQPVAGPFLCLAILVGSSVLCLGQPSVATSESEASWVSNWLMNLRNKMDDARSWDPNSFASFVLYPRQVVVEPSRPTVLGGKRSNGGLDMLAGGTFGGKRSNGALDMFAGGVMGKRASGARHLEGPRSVPMIFYDVSPTDMV